MIPAIISREGDSLSIVENAHWRHWPRGSIDQPTRRGVRQLTDHFAGGRHARHGADQETRRIDDIETSPDAGREAATRVIRGAHAGMDLEEARRMNEADKTAVLDFLYGEGGGAAGAGSYVHPMSDSETVAFSPCGSADEAVAGRSGYGHASSCEPAKTQAFDPVSGESGQPGRYGQSRYGSGDHAGYDDSAHSNVSYVNDTPNARVVGFAKDGGRAFDIDDGLKGRKARKAARERARSSASPSAESAVFGAPALSKGRKGRRGPRRSGGFLSSVLRLLLSLALICAVPLGIYCFFLDQALDLPGDERERIEEVLEPAGVGRPYYALFLGSDSREGASYDTSERSDVIMLVRVDPIGDQATIVTVPRDTPYRLDDGSLVKINEAYSRDGAAGIISAVSSVAGVPISHYAEVGFSDLSAIVDAVGGVSVNVDIPLSVSDPFTGEQVYLDAGTQVLDGQEALVFARARHEYVYDQDVSRQRNDRSLAVAIADSILDRSPLEIPVTTLEVAQYVTTDMKSFNLLATAFPMLLNPGSTQVYSCSGPYAGDINYEAGGLWLCYEDPQGWSDLMAVVDAGDDPSTVSFSY